VFLLFRYANKNPLRTAALPHPSLFPAKRVITVFTAPAAWSIKLARKMYIYALIFNVYTVTMNKAELIEKIAGDADLSKRQANAVLDSFTDAVAKTLKKGDKVTLVGFGTFSVSKRAARAGRNPQTGATIKIKAKKVAKFKAGAALAAKV
jgi:DNA-binding protein HU-beta